MLPSRIPLLPLVVLFLGACSGLPKLETSDFNVGDTFSVYRQDIRQGNFVSQEMVFQLKVGQTREQVRYILGTPLVADPFHSNRWDYVYRFESGKGELSQRTFSVFFDDDNKLKRVGGDVAPVTAAAPEAVASPAPSAAASK